MKKLLILSAVCASILCSCATQFKAKQETEIQEAQYYAVALDFTHYLNQGFSFSTRYLEGKQLGVIDIYYEPAKKVFYERTNIPADDVMGIQQGENVRMVGSELFKPDAKELLDAMYKEAKKLNANGISNLRIIKGSYFYQISGDAVIVD